MGASLAAIAAAAGRSPQRCSSLARYSRASTSRASAPRPSTALGRCACGSGPPSKARNWPQAITSAEPTVKPLITGREKKLARKPMRSRPHSSKTAPATKASCAASTPARAEPGGASGAMAAAVISETMAMGPIDWVMLVPNSAYTMGGRMLAYSPVTGARPATMA